MNKIFSALWVLLLTNQLNSIDAAEKGTELGCTGNICYSINDGYESSSDFDGAKQHCRRSGKTLATVKDKETLNLLAKTVAYETQYWIGLSDEYQDGEWVFTDGTHLNDVQFNPPWRDDSYHSSSYSCAYLYRRRFGATQCHQHLSYICQVIKMPCSLGKLSVPHGVYQNCFTNTTVKSGTKVSVTCNAGYIFQTSERNTNFVTCSNGTWIHPPTCVATCSIPEVNAAKVSILPSKPFYRLQESITLLCPTGYFTNHHHPTSHVSLTCTGLNQWEPTLSSLECVPAFNFLIAQKPYFEPVFQLDVGDSVVLNCIQANSLEYSNGTKFVWLFDQVNVETLPNLNYTIIPSNGNLILNSFRADHEGLYMCLADDFPGAASYKLVVHRPCQQNTTTFFNLILNEDSSHSLVCSDYNYNTTVLPPMWFKDGERIWNTQKYSVLSNGALLIRKVSFSDEGRYSCSTNERGNFCAKNHTVRLTVTSVGSVCGRSGKTDVNPWLVSLWWEEEKTPFCYGARINDRWIISSASCLFGFHRKKMPDFLVNVGDMVSNSSHLVPVESVIIYPFYSRRINYGDIGLIKLKSPLRFPKKDYTKPLCIPETDIGLLKTKRDVCEPVKTLTGTVSGWGTLETTEPTSHKEEELTVAATEDCEFPKAATNMADSMFCATGNAIPQAQAGDLGSPFHLEWEGKVYLYGIFSWGERASMIGKFDYYTKVSAYTKWILSQVQKV